VRNSRKTLSKAIRFEVFKRDSFTCQYCGRKAPEVILPVDHIQAVAGGGTNSITNLITSCRDCNSGKGAKALSDTSTLAKQRRQLGELNERRLQIEMMAEWRAGLERLENEKISLVSSKIATTSRTTISFSSAITGDLRLRSGYRGSLSMRYLPRFV
jgi:hypothetical protein